MTNIVDVKGYFDSGTLIDGEYRNGELNQIETDAPLGSSPSIVLSNGGLASTVTIVEANITSAGGNLYNVQFPNISGALMYGFTPLNNDVPLTLTITDSTGTGAAYTENYAPFSPQIGFDFYVVTTENLNADYTPTGAAIDDRIEYEVVADVDVVDGNVITALSSFTTNLRYFDGSSAWAVTNDTFNYGTGSQPGPSGNTLQMDGTAEGIIPTWTVPSGDDFSISFTATNVVNNLDRMYLGRDDTTTMYLSRNFQGGYRARVANGVDLNLTPDPILADEEQIFFVIERVNGTVTFTAAGETAQEAYNGTVIINRLGSHNSGLSKSLSEFSGILSMTYESGTDNRSYSFNQPVNSTTIPDTISSQDMVLSGFTSGGFVAPPDTTEPVVTINGFPAGNQTINVEIGSSYTLPDATALDNVDGALTVTRDINSVDTSTENQTVATYTATDAAGNIGTATLTINVTDTIAPGLPFGIMGVFFNG